MNHWNSTNDDDRWPVALIRIATKASKRQLRRLARLYVLLSGKPEDVLADAQATARASCNVASYVDDPTAIVVVLNAEYEIEALLGGYLSHDELEAGRGRDAGWLDRLVGHKVISEMHSACMGRDNVFRVPVREIGWSLVGIPTDSGSIIVAYRID